MADLITPDVPLIQPDVPVGAIMPDNPIQPDTGGMVSSFLSGLGRGAKESFKGVAGAAHPFTDQTVPVANDALAQKLAEPLSKGYLDPSWYAAQIGHGIGGAGPMVGGAIAGGAAGEAIEPVGGGIVGAPVGAFVGSVAQELAPAYQAARAQGLSHDAAVDQAIKAATISGAGGALMTVAPIFKLFGTTVEGALKRPISEALAQIFGVQPTIGTATAAAQGAVTGQPLTPEQLAESYITNVGAGAAMTAAHALVPSLRGRPAAPGAEPAIEPITPDRAPQAPAAPLPPIEPGAVVGIKGPGGIPLRAAIQSVDNGVVRWIGEDNQRQADYLADFKRDMTTAPPPAEPIKGDATTVGMPRPAQIGEPAITEPDQFRQAFIEGAPRAPEPVQPPPPPAAQGAIPLADTTAIDANMRAAAVYRVNAEKARLTGAKTPEQIGDMERQADALEQQAQDLRAKLAAPRLGTTDVTLPQAPAAAETLLNRPAAVPGPEPRFGPPTLEGQMGELGRAAPAESVATTGQEPVMGAKPPLAEEIKPDAPQFALEPETPSAPAGRAPAAEKPEDSLFTFLRKKGMQDEGGEMAAMDLGTSGRGRNALIRKSGMDWDEAVRAAQEAGYIGAGAGAGPQTGPETAQGGKAELLDKIRAEAGGQKQYPIGREPVAGPDVGHEADMRERAAMADEATSLRADLASLGETDIYHLDNEALKERLDERLAMTGMDNVADAARAIAVEQATLDRLVAADAPIAAAGHAEDTKGDIHAPREPTGSGGEAAGNLQADAGQPRPHIAPEVPQAAPGDNQAPGIHPQGGPRAPAVERANLWQLSESEVRAALAEEKTSDHEKLVMALGEEGAKQFNRLDRLANSTTADHARADAAAARLSDIEDSLTPRQRQLVYGIGETGATADDLQHMLDAHENISLDVRGNGPDIAHVAWEATLGLRSVTPAEILAVRKGSGSVAAQVAYVRLMRGYEELRSRGVAPQDIPGTLAQGMAQISGMSPGDATDFVGSFLQAAQAGRAPTPRAETIQTIEGPQQHYVLPGIERSAVQAQAARDTQRGLTSSAPQKAADEGLFAEPNRQIDIEDVLPKTGAKMAPGVDPSAIASGIQRVGQEIGRLFKDEGGGTPRTKDIVDATDGVRVNLSKDPLNYQSMSAWGRIAMLEAGIDARDRISHAYVRALDDRKAGMHTLVQDGIERMRSLLRTPESDPNWQIAKAQLEHDRMNGIDRQATGRPLVIAVGDRVGGVKPEVWPLDLSKPGQLLRGTPESTALYFQARDYFNRQAAMLAEGIARKIGYQGPFIKEDGKGGLAFDHDAIKAAAEGAGTDKGIRTAAERAAEIAQEAELERRKGYVPLMRYGDYYVKITPKVPTMGEGIASPLEGRTEFVYSQRPLDSIRGAVKSTYGGELPKLVGQRIAELKQRYDPAKFDYSAGKVTPKEFADMNLPALQKLFSAMTMDDPKLGAQMYDAVLKKLFEDRKAGFRRQSLNVPGYSTDFKRAFSDYIRQSSAVVANMTHGDRVNEAFDATQQHQDARVRSYWAANKAYSEKPENQLINLGQRFGFFNYLWGTIGSPVVQAFHTPIITSSQLMGIAGPRGPLLANAAFLEAFTGIKADLRHGLDIDYNRLGRTPGERAMLKQFGQEGLLDAGFTRELAGGDIIRTAQMREAMKPLVRVYDIGLSAFNTVVKANNVAAALSYYRAAHAPGVMERAAKVYANDASFPATAKEDYTPLSLARWGVRETQFRSGKESKAPLQRGVGTLAFQFQHFNWNALRLLNKNLTRMGPEGIAAATMMGAGLIGVGGLGGLPFVNNVKDLATTIYKNWTGIDPRFEARFREFLMDHGFGQLGAEIMTHGPSRALAGVDIGQRIGIGSILPGSTDITTDVPVLDAIIGRASEITKRINAGQPRGAFAAGLPSAFANPIKALYAWPQEGISPQGGGTPYFRPSQVTPEMQTARSLGFQPAAVARRQEFMNDQNAIKYATDEAEKTLVKSISDNYGRSIDAMQNGDPAAAAEYRAQAEQLLKDNATRLADPTIDAWQQIPQPMAKALRSRIGAYLAQPGYLPPKTNKFKAGEMLGSPYLSQ